LRQTSLHLCRSQMTWSHNESQNYNTISNAIRIYVYINIFQATSWRTDKQLENHIKGPIMHVICKKLEIYVGQCTSSKKELPSTQKKFLKQSHNEPFVLWCYCYTNHSLLFQLEFQNTCNANDKIKECSWWVTNSNIKH
jgi:hypothetical protein